MKMRAVPKWIQDAFLTGDIKTIVSFCRENPVKAEKIKKCTENLHNPHTCSTCMQVEELGMKITSVSDPHWGCLLESYSSIIELTNQTETSKFPFAMGEQTGEFTSRYEQTLSLMQRVLHKMYLVSHPLVADDARLRSLFQYIGGLRTRLLILAIQIPSGQILEYFHQGDILEDLKGDNYLLKLVREMSEESSSLEDYDGPYNLWKTFQILVFFCLNPTHADRVLFEELGEEVEDETLANALSKNDTSEKFNMKLVAVLKGLEKGVMPFNDLLDILCEDNRQKTCSACNSTIYVEDIQFPCFVKPPTKPFVLCIFGTSAFSCASMSCFETVRENTLALVMTLQTIYQNFALKYTPNRCDMCFKFSKKVHRCGRCLTKVYCSKQCMDLDWSLIHKEICKKEQDGRKVKGGSQERNKDGKKKMKDYRRDLRLEENCEGFLKNPELKEIVMTSTLTTAKKLKEQLN